MSDTQTITVITTKVFNSLREMKKSTELSVGMMCETLGYYEKGDGGGARYTIEAIGDTVANEMDIIAIGTDNTLIAKYLYEGKPVNVLQFGAINTYTTEKPGYIPYYKENGKELDTRDDQPKIQRAIDYTHDKLISYEEHDVNGTAQNCYKNAINTIVIPEGNYVIKTQIKLPPYMRFYLEGDVQFLSVVKPFDKKDIKTFKLEETDASTYKFVAIDSFDNVPEKTEIFANNDFCCGDTKLKLSDSEKQEFYVYKHGTIKICYKFDENGNPINPYKTKAKDRYAVSPSINNEIFCGPGSLTLNNLVNDDGLLHYYICGIEIGSTEENIRYYADGSSIKGKHLSYENLRFKKLKIRGFHIGMLQHGYSFYSNVISDTEFWDNDIAFQFGIYGEEDDMKGDNGGYIIREEGLECGEMNHFRDCLFTGNRISVNMMLSGCNTYFTECHFDFENCLFRAAYRVTITVDKCHIEGTGRELSRAYFQEKDEATDEYLKLPITKEMLDNFKNRASVDPLDEFVGIMYAKPITKFNGDQVAQYSYVNLNITSSRIVDNEFIPWGLFSYYNSGTAETCDGHFRSKLYLNNNSYSIGNDIPISFGTTKDNGIIQSGFLLSEFPERKLPSNAVGTEQDAVQNIPATSCNSSYFRTFISHLEPRKNHRFLSNRTLENKYPYFQNIPTSGSLISFTEAIDISLEKELDENYIVENTYVDMGKNKNNNVFAYFDKEAKFIDIWGTALTKVLEEKEEVEQPKICMSIKDDFIPCKRGDLLYAALVTNHIVYNNVIRRVKDKETNEEIEVRCKEPVVHSISFVELDSENTEIGRYDYDVPYILSSGNENEYDVASFPSTSACGHFVKNKSTAKVKIVAKICVPLAYNLADDLHFTLNAIFVEKNM